MALNLHAVNFRQLRDVLLNDDGKLSFVLGPNEAGKSTLVQSISFAATGEAFGYKGKDAVKLIRRGANGPMSVSVECGKLRARRTASGGDALRGIATDLGCPAEILPLLFNAKLASDGGNRYMQAFLRGLAETGLDIAATFKGEPDVLECAEQAKRGGALTAKKVVEFCEAARARHQPPPRPSPPAIPRPAAETVAALTTAQQTARTAAEAAKAASTEQDALWQRLRALLTYQRSLQAWEQQRAAYQDDVLGARRTAIEAAAALSDRTIVAMLTTLTMAGLASGGPLLMALQAAKQALPAVVEEAAGVLQRNPRAVPLAPKPVLDPALQPLAAELGTSDVAALEAACGPMVQSLRQAAAAAAAQVVVADMALRDAQQAVGAWNHYEQQAAAYTTLAVAAEKEWAKWDKAAKKIAAADAEFTAAQGQSFGTLVAATATHMLNGRQVTINPKDGVFLGAEPAAELSDSTRWRTEVAIMAAIARAMRSPILAIDAADILDASNKAGFIQFLNEAAVPHFEHVLVTATPRGQLADEQPVPGLTKWLLERGELRRLG